MIQQLNKLQDHTLNLDYIYNSHLNKIAKQQEKQLVGAIYQSENWLNNEQFNNYMNEIASNNEEEDNFADRINSLESNLEQLNKEGCFMQFLCMDYYQTGSSSPVYKDEEPSVLQERIDEIKKAPESMYLNNLQSGTEVTINSLYESLYKGSYRKEEIPTGSEQADRLLQLNHMEVTEGGRWAVQLLADYGVEVNQDNIIRLQNIKEQVDKLDSQNEAILGNISGDRPLLTGTGAYYEEADINYLKEQLGQITEDHINELITSEEEITIGNLKEMLYKNTQVILQGGQEGSETGKGNQASEQIEAEEIKEQIEQIRLKLTAEAAQKISEQMPLESSRLSDVVTALNALEDTRIDEIAVQIQAELSPEDKTQIKQVLETTQYMKLYPEVTVDIELSHEQEASLNQLHHSLMSYSQNELQPETRFGETTKMVEGQIEALLEKNNLSVNEENIQAAKALITNGMEVDEEKLQEVLELGIKINTFLEEMTPLNAIRLIKEGKNIYESSVDELLIEMTQERANQLKTSVAEAIVALEEQGQINEEQKKSMLGLYRILHAVNSQREEVAGYLYKNELPLTIKRLQEAVKYTQIHDHIIDQVADLDTGEIQEIDYRSQTAQAMMEEGQKQAMETSKILAQIENMALPVTETDINKLQKINALLYPYIKQEFKKQFNDFKGLSTLPESFLNKLESIKQMSGEETVTMLGKGLEPTVSNLYWFNEMNQKTEVNQKFWEKFKELTDEEVDDLNEVEKQLAKAEKEADRLAELAISVENMNQYKFYKEIQEMAEVQKQLTKEDVFYQVPLFINGEQKLLNLYVNKDANQKKSSASGNKLIVMQYETQNMGKVEVQITLNGKQIDYKLKGENQEIAAKFREKDAKLQEKLEEVGCTARKSEFQSEKSQDHSLTGLIKSGERAFEEII